MLNKSKCIGLTISTPNKRCDENKIIKSRCFIDSAKICLFWFRLKTCAILSPRPRVEILEAPNPFSSLASPSFQNRWEVEQWVIFQSLWVKPTVLHVRLLTSRSGTHTVEEILHHLGWLKHIETLVMGYIYTTDQPVIRISQPSTVHRSGICVIHV